MTITAQKFKDAVLDVLAERGDDFVYDPPEEGTCVYSEDGGQTGSCLFGAALIDKLGVEYRPDWDDGDTLLGDILDSGLGLDGYGSLAGVALEAQALQDSRRKYKRVREYLKEKGGKHS